MRKDLLTEFKLKLCMSYNALFKHRILYCLIQVKSLRKLVLK